jgi:lipoate-protein ligase A
MSERKKWRLVIGRTHGAMLAPAWGPAIAKARDEGKIPDTVAFFYVDEPGIYMQRYQDALMDINYDNCKKYNVHVARAPTAGGGAGYHEHGIEPFLIFVWDMKSNPDIPIDSNLLYPRFLCRGADIMSEKYRIPVRFRLLNDVEIWDPEMRVWRKCMGVGSYTVGGAAGFAWFPFGFKSSELVSKVMVSPKDKFADKTLKEVSLRNWNFEEAGAFKERAKFPSRDELVNDWIDITLEVIKTVFGVEAEPGEFIEEEIKYAEDIYKMFSSEEWIFAKSAEKKFGTIPEGTSLGKHSVKVAGGPLIRAYVLRRGDTIEDIMFTGTLHMSPPEALEDAENELKGCKIDENLIRTKVEEVFTNKNVIMGLGSPSLVSDTVIQACKESYK